MLATWDNIMIIWYRTVWKINMKPNAQMVWIIIAAQTYVLLCVICTFVLYVNFQYMVVCNVFTQDCYQDYNEKHSNLSKLAGVKIQIHFKFCFIQYSRCIYKGKHFKADEKLFREYCVVYSKWFKTCLMGFPVGRETLAVSLRKNFHVFHLI